jgi:Ca2+-transporting ATPase
MLGAIALGAFMCSLYGLHQEVAQARTVAFAMRVMVIAQLVHSFNCRSTRLSLLQVGAANQSCPPSGLCVVARPTGGGVLMVLVAAPIFKMASLPMEDWVMMGAMGILPLLVLESIKWLKQQ